MGVSLTSSDGSRGPGLKVLAIIPARGGSKRILHKNIRKFHGRPMLSYSLKTAENSGLFEHIHVSTDDDQIAQVAKDAGHPVTFKRDDRLADDQTGVVAVLKNDLAEFESLGETYDAVVMILACAPLLLPSDLTGAMDLYLRRGEKHPVMAVCKFPVPPEWAFTMSDEGELTPADPQAILRNSQTFPERYFDAASFIVFPSPVLRSAEPCDIPYIGYELPPYRAVDIDVEDDWRTAELIYGGLLNEAK